MDCIHPVGSKKGKTISESLEESFTSKKKEKIREAHFDCSVLFEEAKWHHLVIVIYKNVMRSTTASLYLDGSLVDTQKVCMYLCHFTFACVISLRIKPQPILWSCFGRDPE